MKVMVVGSGGREHALVQALVNATSVKRVFCAPGNPGTEAIADNLAIPAGDIAALVAAAGEHELDLVVVGPEAPLVAGLGDALRASGVAVFGPSRAAAEIEGSKVFAKKIMQRGGVPTGAASAFDSIAAARDHLDEQFDFPIVVKASGLAAGKGVLICHDQEEALAAVDTIMRDRSFGSAGESILIEEFLTGSEASIHALCDGRTLALLPTAEDHKQAFDGDRGPNTGGMGAVSPDRRVRPRDLQRIERQVFFPTIHELTRERRPFRGVLFAGLMMTPGGPKVLEFNARFGDPETQAILPRLSGDLGELLLATAEGRLDGIDPSLLAVRDEKTCTVVLTSKGYPAAFDRGFPIEGLEKAEALDGVRVCHAGTQRNALGELVTAGGRVLSVTALAADAEAARAQAYRAAELIHFEGKTQRSDIGARSR